MPASSTVLDCFDQCRDPDQPHDNSQGCHIAMITDIVTLHS